MRRPLWNLIKSGSHLLQLESCKNCGEGPGLTYKSRSARITLEPTRTEEVTLSLFEDETEITVLQNNMQLPSTRIQAHLAIGVKII